MAVAAASDFARMQPTNQKKRDGSLENACRLSISWLGSFIAEEIQGGYVEYAREPSTDAARANNKDENKV